jgi:hypothetical protein
MFLIELYFKYREKHVQIKSLLKDCLSDPVAASISFQKVFSFLKF